jgi:hypothetical protein
MICVTPTAQNVVPHKVRVILVIFMLGVIKTQPFHDSSRMPIGKAILKEI